MLGADLQGADLQDENLQEADLQGANLRGANLRGANLSGADLRGANLQRAGLQEADLQDANLQRADLQGANLQEADLQDANLQDANLQRADLQGVKLEGAKYDPEQLQRALNVPQEYLKDNKPTSTDVYRRRAKDAQRKVTALEQEKRELKAKLKAAEQASTDIYQRRAEENQSKVTILEQEKRELESKLKAVEQDGAQSDLLKQSLEDTESELSQVRNQLEQNQQKQEALDELAGAIEPIMEAVKSDKETVEDYKLQSQRLLKWGLICFGFATGFIIWKGVCPALPWQALCAAENVSGAELLLQIAPGFVFAILGSALLRHDWKIRQLTLELIDQNNSVDIAMGMLKTALRLSNIGEKKDIEGIPDLVKESFAEARRALLYRNRSDAPASADDSGKDAGSLKRIENMLVKHFNSTNTTSS